MGRLVFAPDREKERDGELDELCDRGRDLGFGCEAGWCSQEKVRRHKRVFDGIVGGCTDMMSGITRNTHLFPQ